MKSIAVRHGQDKLIGQVSERHTQSHELNPLSAGNFSIVITLPVN